MRRGHQAQRDLPSTHHDPAEAAYAVVAGFLTVRDRLRQADAILTFGCRDLTVAGQAAALFSAGWAPYVVTTGGVAFDRERTEAEAFADHLLAAGVPRDRILLEPWSRHTGENVRFALDLLGNPRRVIAVPWPLAARRAVATLRHQAPGLDVISAPDRVGPGARRPFGPRAAGAALAELDRLDRYAAAGFIAPAAIPDRIRAAATVLQDHADRPLATSAV